MGSHRESTAAVHRSLERWKAQQPAPQNDFFCERLLRDALTEKELLAILGLPPAVYSGLITEPPDWVVDLERLFVGGCSVDADPAFSPYVQEQANRFLWIAAPLVREGLRRFRGGIGRLELTSAPFDASAGTSGPPHLLHMLRDVLDLVMVLKLTSPACAASARATLHRNGSRAFASISVGPLRRSICGNTRFCSGCSTSRP